jgi:hypothetical protein
VQVSISYLWNRLHRNDNALMEYGFFQQVPVTLMLILSLCSEAAIGVSTQYFRNSEAARELPNLQPHYASVGGSLPQKRSGVPEAAVSSSTQGRRPPLLVAYDYGGAEGDALRRGGWFFDTPPHDDDYSETFLYLASRPAVQELRNGLPDCVRHVNDDY